jgi:hypothetical protein
LYAVVAVFLLLVSNDRKNGPPLLSRKDPARVNDPETGVHEI